MEFFHNESGKCGGGKNKQAGIQLQQACMQCSQYAGTVMTLFDHVLIPTRGNWFHTNPLEHESDDPAGNTVSSV